MKFCHNFISILLLYVKHATATKSTNAFSPQPNPYRLFITISDGAGDGKISIKGMGAHGRVNGRGVNGTVIPMPGLKKAIVVEFDSETDVAEFMAANKNSKVEIQVDKARYLQYADKSLDQRANRLAQYIPWGINKVFEDANGIPDVPDSSYFPVTTSNPICIIDSGIELSHPDLPNDVSDADPSKGNSFSTDSCGHGTVVAGTVIATDNDKGVIGVYPSAPGVKIMKVFDEANCYWSYSSTLMQAVTNCVDSGAKIISMSLGGPDFMAYEDFFYQRLYDDQDLLLIAAAGNDGNEEYLYPASYSSVISVGATDIDGNIASFSQYNDQVDVSAPGVDVVSTIYDDEYISYSGTSMATPHVSGIALLLWSKYPSCTNSDIRHAIESTAEDLGTPGRDNFFGYGLAKYWSADSHMSDMTTMPTTTPSETMLPSTECINGRLEIKTDEYPDETNWKINDSSGNHMYSGGAYTNKKTLYVEEFCMSPNKCYMLIMSDSAEDGICCSHGNGFYKLYYDNEVVKEGAEYQKEETSPFFGNGCNTTYTKSPTSLLSATPSISPTITPISTNPDLCSLDKVPFMIDLQTDFYGRDISWRLEINTRGNYWNLVARNGLTYDGNTRYQENICISMNECYKFIISDAAQDGLCCTHSNGYYGIYLNSEYIVVNIFILAWFLNDWSVLTSTHLLT